MYFDALYCIKQNGGQISNFAERKTCVQYSCQNLEFSESSVLAEVGNKALAHTFDVLNPKILVTKFDFVF